MIFGGTQFWEGQGYLSAAIIDYLSLVKTREDGGRL